VSHSPPAPNPTGGDGVWRGLTQPALHEELMARVLDRANVRRAWKRVKANQGAPGIDGTRISVTRFLTCKLALVVNEHKSRVVETNDCQFLGSNFRGTKLRWSDRAFEDFEHNVRRLTGRSWGVSMTCRFMKLARYVRGWMGYFGISHYDRPIPEIDHWLRRRARRCYWKQWRCVRTKVRNLLASGTSKRQAILTAL